MCASDHCGSFRRRFGPRNFAHWLEIELSILSGVSRLVAAFTCSKTKRCAQSTKDFNMGFSSLDIPRVLFLKTAAVFRWGTSHIHLSLHEWQAYTGCLVVFSGKFDPPITGYAPPGNGAHDSILMPSNDI
jgi:hypothetical protein